MLKSRRLALCAGWQGWPAVVQQAGFRAFMPSPGSSVNREGMTADPSLSSSADTPTQLHSVYSIREGYNAFAAATVTFDLPKAETTSGCGATAQHAAEVALLALRSALGAQLPPSAVVAFTSLELPRAAVQAVAEALRGQLGPGVSVIGCSSRLRLLDEYQLTASVTTTATTTNTAAATAQGDSTGATTAAAATSAAGGTAGPREAQAAAPRPRPTLHLTLAGAHLPGHEVLAVRSETSSLPRLPYLADALQGRRPPNFLLVTNMDSQASELLSRLENLFPGSCIGAGVAAQPNLRDRQRGLMLVGPGGGGEAASRGSGPQEGERLRAPGQGADGASTASARSVESPGRTAVQRDSGEMYGIGGTGSGGPASDLEGPFQSMLLDRQGSAAAANSSRGEPSAAGTSDLGRRRHAPTASSAPASATSTTAAAGPLSAGNYSDNVTEAAAPVEGTLPPYLILGDELHHGGCAMLAIYPRTEPRQQPTEAAATGGVPSSSAAAGAAAGGAAAASAGVAPGRLSGAACDRLARVALGTDHLLHVALRGTSLAAILPPPTGPEPCPAFPPAPDNPYYWWAATVGLRGEVVDPHLDPRPATDPEPPSRVDPLDPVDSKTSDTGRRSAPVLQTPSAAGQAPSSTSPPTLGSGLQGGSGEGNVPGELYGAVVNEEAVEDEVDGSDGSEDEDDDLKDADEDGDTPSAADLLALREGLTGLPLFPLKGTTLFPGQTIQLRVFEKRYRLLMRSCIEQGAMFGVCWQGMGTTAVVRSYQRPEDDSSDLMVLLEGGTRFSYSPQDLTLLPASYGLNVAKHSQYVVDDPPAREEDRTAMLVAAGAIIDGVVGALEAATAPPAQHAARTFTNALHFASSQQQPAAASPPPAAGWSSPPGPSTSGAISSGPSDPPSCLEAPEASAPDTAGAAAAGSLDAESDAALLAGDVAEAKRVLDADTASLLSLYLAPHIPVHLEPLQRQWFTTRSALWRLQQEAAWLRSNQRVCLAVASSVMRLPREHPLRVMMGLSRVAAVM